MSQLVPGAWAQSRSWWLTEQIPGQWQQGAWGWFVSALLSRAAFSLSAVGRTQVLWLYFSAKLCHPSRWHKSGGNLSGSQHELSYFPWVAHCSVTPDPGWPRARFSLCPLQPP